MADPATAAAMRWLHLVAVAVLLGGAVLLAGLATRRGAEPRVVVAAAMAFEPWAWAALGLVVLSGVGNAAALGPGLVPPGAPWGDRFALKMGGVAALLAVSLVRTLVVALARAAPGEPPPRALRVVGGAYALTAALLAGLAALGVLLGHG